MKKILTIIIIAVSIISCEYTINPSVTITAVNELGSLYSYELTLDDKKACSGELYEVAAGSHVARVNVFDPSGIFLDSEEKTVYVDSGNVEVKFYLYYSGPVVIGVE